MKNFKLIALFITVLMFAGIFAGCGAKQEQAAAPQPAEQQTAQPEAPAKKKILAGVAIRTLSNPYMVQVKEGAEMWAKTITDDEVEVQILTCEGSDEKQINDIKALIARGGKDTILYVDPNQSPNAAEIAEICEEAGVYWVSVWNMADGVFPYDYKYYVAHHSPDNIKSGYDIAVEMFKNFKTPGKGKILVLQGMLANTAAIDRFKGLERALKEYPDVQILDNQSGDWSGQKALTITETWLSKHKDIDGIWAANDDMALGAVQALKAKGLNGKVKVVGVDGINDAITAIQNGDMIATVGSNGWLQGGYSLSYAYAALKGKIDTSTMKPEERLFHTEGLFVSKANVKEYEEKFIKNKPQYDFTDLKGIVVRPMDIPKK